MKTRKIIAVLFILIALTFGIIFYQAIGFPAEIGAYFKQEFYSQYGPLAICVELFIAGLYLFSGHSKANFTLALFGFTALLDPFFDLIGLFTSLVPTYASVVFGACAVVALWLAFSNTFNLGKISFLGALGSFILGNLVELFFNYF